MGTSHAISGAAAWVAISSTAVPALGWYPLDGVGVIAGAIVAAGAALLPDADHPSATIAHSIPGGSAITGALGAASGGHRKGMHSLLAVLVVTVGAWVASVLRVTPEGWDRPLQLGAAVSIIACVCFALKAMKLVRTWPKAWLGGLIAAAALIWILPDGIAWFPWAIGSGYLVHLLGDFLTTGGVPWLWPWMPKPPQHLRKSWLINVWRPYGGFAAPVLGNAGSYREWLLTIPLAGYTLWGLAMGVTTLPELLPLAL